MLSVVCRQMVEKAAASFKIKREEELVSRQDDVCVVFVDVRVLLMLRGQYLFMNLSVYMCAHV